MPFIDTVLARMCAKEYKNLTLIKNTFIFLSKYVNTLVPLLSVIRVISTRNISTISSNKLSFKANCIVLGYIFLQI